MSAGWGLFISMVISGLAPFVLLIYSNKRFKTNGKSHRVIINIAGIATYFIFGYELARLIHYLVLEKYKLIQGMNGWEYFLFVALVAVITEETSRIIVMKFILNKWLDIGNAVIYGIGYSGAEAIWVGSMRNLWILLMRMMYGYFNSVVFIREQEGWDDLTDMFYKASSVIDTVPAVWFYIGGIQILLKFAFQLLLTWMLYRGIRTGEKKFYIVAYAAHFLVYFLLGMVLSKNPFLQWNLELLYFD